MNRIYNDILDKWLKESGRKPLILRGARQVGKTWLIRSLAQRNNRELVEINFERDIRARSWFASNDPKTILSEISLALNRPLIPESMLLFLDEIQAAGEVIAKLRWFTEEMPGLAVAAAGSLLEFTLGDHSFSMPVGRVSFLHIEPMGFPEFLAAHGQTVLHERLGAWSPGDDFSVTLHEQAQTWFHRYMMVGGMPAIVAQDAGGATPQKLRGLQSDLVATYRADFAKYRGTIAPDTLDATLLAVSRSLGRKFVYARVSDDIRQHHAGAAGPLPAVQPALVHGVDAGGVRWMMRGRDRSRASIVFRQL